MPEPDMAPRVFDAVQTRSALPYTALCDAIAEVLEAYRTGRVIAPERLAVSLGEQGTLLLMPATDGRTAITKLVTVHPANREKRLPTIQGEVIVFEAATGRRLGILDGVTVTARRTAALSALAARTLAPNPSGPLLVIGAGAQARSHLEAYREVLAIDKAVICSRTRAHAEALADYARSLGFQIDVADESGINLKRCDAYRYGHEQCLTGAKRASFAARCVHFCCGGIHPFYGRATGETCWPEPPLCRHAGRGSRGSRGLHPGQRRLDAGDSAR